MTKRPEGSELLYPILVIKAKKSGGIWALPVTRRGPYLSNIVARVCKIINGVGSPKIIMKTDQEPSMIAMQHEIRKELSERLDFLRNHNKLLEAQRLEQRTHFDIEMMIELGYCSGIENYSRFFSGREVGEKPYTLIDFFAENFLILGLCFFTKL